MEDNEDPKPGSNAMAIYLNEANIIFLENLKHFHGDPFDRLVISQAFAENTNFES